MKAAIIENGKVVNIAKVADEAFAQAQGWVVSDTAKIGDEYDAANDAFITPPEPAPEPRTKDDLRAELSAVHDRYCSGTTPYGGIEIAIDVEARVNAQGTLAAVQRGQQPVPFAWFSGSQSVTVSSEQDMQAIHDTIFAALQRRYAAKGKVLASIETLSNPDAYNVEQAYRAHL